MLFLHVHYFFVQVSPDTKLQGILNAYTTAELFISAAASGDEAFGLYSHITSYLFRMLFTAACVVWKVYNSSYYSHVDLNASSVLFGRAVSALHKCSVENNDNAGRQAEILVQLWCGQLDTHSDRRRTCEPSLEFNSRYSASLAYDCLFYWRDYVGGQATNGLHSSTTREYNCFGDDSQPTNRCGSTC